MRKGDLGSHRLPPYSSTAPLFLLRSAWWSQARGMGKDDPDESKGEKLGKSKDWKANHKVQIGEYTPTFTVPQ